MDKYGNTFNVTNIIAKINGKHKAVGSYILLISHYDASPKKTNREDKLSIEIADDG